MIHLVCFECWSRTQTFDSFYKVIENTHRNFFAKGLVSSKNNIDLSASSNQGENDDLHQPIVLYATSRNIGTVLTEGDDSCGSEHFVAYDELSNTNDHNVEINQRIDFVTGT